MAETKLEGARERLGRLMTKAVVAGGYPADDEDQSNDAHLGREFIRSRADLRLILAELDRRSPPTREASPIIERLESIAHHFESSGYAHGQHVDKARAAREAARMIAALAAAPPPPDVSRGLDREAVARLAYFMAVEGEASEEDARSPLNDGHWAHWKVHPDYQCCFRLADAIIALSAPAGGGMDSLRPSGAPQPALGGKPPLDEPERAAGAWRPIGSAPRDGTSIRVLYDDGTVEDGVYWSNERCCILGPRAGAYPPGWVSREAGDLPVGHSPDITHWMPALAERDPSAVAPELGGGKLRSEAEPQNAPADTGRGE